jgi:hypothetical protein
MEAMWINFKCEEGKKFVIRPFLGGVNGISGEASIGDMGSLMRRMNKLGPTQDYIVLPDQMWLDGISTRPGIVRQFVAAEIAPPRLENRVRSRNFSRPLNSMAAARYRDQSTHKDVEEEQNPVGASIEWQVTGQDAVGGIQLQIIPTFDVDRIFAGSVKDVCRISVGSGDLTSYDDSIIDDVRVFDVLNTPRDEGLQPGDVIQIKDLKSQLVQREKIVSDLLGEAPGPLSAQDVVEVQVQYEEVDKCKFIIRCPGRFSSTISIEAWETPRSLTIA